ncbi:MAG: NADH-quinone oxidoreductase subunit A [Chthoniobacteraceae bacterium]|nr:NADH-quinone oxidoreductase subunit A [Chthoniobacteraceae bacterium]
MLKDYLPLLIQVLVAIGFVTVALVFSVLLGKTGRRNPTKDSPYECGMLPIGGAQPRFAVKFYLVAMLFILFDLEVVFMYPWAAAYREYLKINGPLILWSMLSFIGVITVGYVYAIKKGVLDWKR